MLTTIKMQNNAMIAMDDGIKSIIDNLDRIDFLHWGSLSSEYNLAKSRFYGYRIIDSQNNTVKELTSDEFKKALKRDYYRARRLGVKVFFYTEKDNY